MTKQDPRPFSIQAHRWEEEEWSRVGLGAQELHTWFWGSGDLWEHKSTMHWVLVTSRTELQGQLDHSGRPRHQPSVEDRHALLITLTPNTRSSLKGFQQWQGSQRLERWVGL